MVGALGTQSLSIQIEFWTLNLEIVKFHHSPKSLQFREKQPFGNLKTRCETVKFHHSPKSLEFREKHTLGKIWKQVVKPWKFTTLPSLLNFVKNNPLVIWKVVVKSWNFTTIPSPLNFVKNDPSRNLKTSREIVKIHNPPPPLPLEFCEKQSLLPHPKVANLWIQKLEFYKTTPLLPKAVVSNI